MTAICNGVDLSDLIGYGYTIEQVPQYGAEMTAIDGTDYSVKIRDRWHLIYPFIMLTKDQLQQVMQLFPDSGAYVEWTFYDEQQGADVTALFKYQARKAALRVRYRSGVEYWDGLSVELLER